MNRGIIICRYEYKMLLKRPGGWLVFAFAMAVAILDAFPSDANLNRLEFLPQPSYFIRRIIAFYGLLLLFGLMFMLAGRIPNDRNNGIMDLFRAMPVGKKQYLLGKLAGGFLYAFSMLLALLAGNLILYTVFAPASFSLPEYIFPLLTGVFSVILPACFFVAACSVMLPAVFDIRLFYLAFSVLFILNAFTVGSAKSVPFYMITGGDLSGLIWRHPKFPAQGCSGFLKNLLFLTGSGLLSILSVKLKPGFWRADQ